MTRLEGLGYFWNLNSLLGFKQGCRLTPRDASRTNPRPFQKTGSKLDTANSEVKSHTISSLNAAHLVV
jgi:hypothetical protein